MHCYTDDVVSRSSSCRVGTSAHKDGTSNFLFPESFGEVFEVSPT
jgi:hypothetical protein